MRNLMEYPITKDEIEQYLKTLADWQESQERIGDMGPFGVFT